MRSCFLIHALTAPILASTLRPRQADGLSRCTSSTFSQPPVVDGLEILAVEASPLYNFTVNIYAYGNTTTIQQLCNVTVTYTHPGYNDTIHNYHYLPLEGWSGRLVGLGGGGWAGFDTGVGFAEAWAHGCAVIGSDAGHGPGYFDPSPWVQSSPGNVNYNLLQDFAYKSMEDLPKIGKQIVTTYYSKTPDWLYFIGGSGGGRMAFVNAQMFPNAYHGILGLFPAINWSRLFSGALWPQIVMKEEGYYPSPCELNAFNKALTKSCDGLDGVIDGIVGNPLLCKFDPQSLVGATADCPDNSTITVTAKAATIVAKIWEGPVDIMGTYVYEPYMKGAALDYTGNTSVNGNGTRGPNPVPLPVFWFKDLVVKNTTFDPLSLDYVSYANLSSKGVQQYTSIMDFNDPNLKPFRDAGGKLISWMGTLDQIISTNDFIQYHGKVRDETPDVDDFWRLFLAPGMVHGTPNSDGTGYAPYQNGFNQLMEWVEKGVAPNQLPATNKPTGGQQPLCVYPKVAKWDGVNNNMLLASYTCEDSY